MRPLVPLVVLVLLAPSLSAEIPISQPRAVPVFPAAARTPQVTAGDGFLVAWSEHSNLGYSHTVKVRLYGDDRAPRHPVPFTLGAAAQAITPRAFWNGSEYVVLWGTPYPKFGGTIEQPVVFAARVSADGTVFAGSQAVLQTARPGTGVIAVAFDGTKALAAAGDGSNYHLLTLDRNGNLLEKTKIEYRPAGIAAKPGGGFFVLRSEQGDSVAAGSDRLAVLDHGSHGVTATILGIDGAELQRFALTQLAASSSAIAWDGARWVAVFNAGGSTCTARFSNADDVQQTCEDPGAEASVDADSSGVFRAWIEGSQVMTEGGLASTMWTSAYNPDAVVDQTGLLAVWTETNEHGSRIRLGGIRDDGTSRPEIAIPATGHQYTPLLARAGNQTLLTWWENRTIRAARVGVAPSAPMEVASGGPFAHHAAGRGAEWVVAWHNTAGIETARITHDLRIAEREQFRVATDTDAPAIAATASGYLLAWAEFEATTARVVTQPLDERGRRTSSQKMLTTTLGVQFLGIACGPETCLLAGYRNLELWTLMVRHDGTPVGAEHISPGSLKHVPPVITAAADGTYRVYQGELVMSVSASGEPGAPKAWTSFEPTVGAVVTWRGRPAIVYSRSVGATWQVFAAHDPVPRVRSVRR